MGRLSVGSIENLNTGYIVDARYLTEGSTKSWINCSATGTLQIRDSLNVSSMVDGGTGGEAIIFTHSFVNTNYAVAGISSTPGATNGFIVYRVGSTSTQFNTAGVVISTGAAFDPSQLHLAFWGHLA